MLRPKTEIYIIQQPSDVYPNRNLTINIDFVNSGEINSTWQNLTTTAKLKLPHNIQVQDNSQAPGELRNWVDDSLYGETKERSEPLFMRGDKIEIYLGYYSSCDLDDQTGVVIGGDNVGEYLWQPENPQFKGYISAIKNSIPIEIECEDEMWKLKQIRPENKLYKDAKVGDMLTDLLKGTQYKVDTGGFETNIGNFRVQNETISQVLDRLKKEGGLYFYFRGTTLSASGLAYDPQYMNVEEVFEFQKNIISDSMRYTRKDDLDIVANVYAKSIINSGGKNADGTDKKTQKRLEVTVGKIDKLGNFGKIEKGNGRTFAEVINLPVPGAKTEQDLIDYAKKYLPKFFYSGFRGGFDTFGYPVVTHGNVAIIRDKKLPEKDGKYLIKSVNTTFGMGSIRQKIGLAIRIDKGFTMDDLNKGLAG